MLENYADVLESYMIPAEEGFKDSFKTFFNENMSTILATLTGAIISIPIIIKAIKKYKFNRLLRPFAPAQAIALILANKKYKTVQFNSNIHEYIRIATDIIKNAEELFAKLNKAVVEKDENKTIVAFDGIVTYFEDAIENELPKVPDGEVVTVDKDSIEVENLRDDLDRYFRTCKRSLARCEDIFNNFIETKYIPSYQYPGYYSKVDVDPGKNLITAMEDYESIIERFHYKVIAIKIKKK